MSRDLEREYRALVNSEAPDLWARIEAGLEDKKTASGTGRTDIHITDFSVTDTQMEHTRVRKANFKLWAGLAAACACVALIVPAMVRVGMSKGSGYSSSTPSYTADMASPSAESGGRADSNAGWEEAAYEHGDEKNAVLQGNAQTIADSDMNGADAAGGVQMEEAAAEPDSEPYRFHATVEILGTDMRMDSGVLYMAKVLSSDHSGMEEGSEIKIYCSAVSSDGMMMLEDYQTYDLELCEDHSGEAGQEVIYLLVDE